MTAVTTLSPDTDTPAWITHVLTVAIPLAGFGVSLWDPNGALKSGPVEAAVILGSFVIAAAIHLVRLVAKNGLTRVGLEHDITTTETWLHENSAVVKSTFDQVAPLLNLIPEWRTALMKVSADVAQVKGRVDAIPADQTAAAVAALRAILGPTQTLTPVAAPVATG
jgi:hypothetical protein